MRKIERSNRFVDAYNRCLDKYQDDIVYLDKVIMILAEGHKLNPKYKDHQLKGDLSKYRECHIVEISNDWLLIYRPTKTTLYLVDTGSHNELFARNH